MDEPKAKDKQRQEIAVESVSSYPEAVQYLEKIVSRMKAGSVTLAQGEQSVTLTPAENVKVKIKGRQQRDKESISVKITWSKAPASPEATEISIS